MTLATFALIASFCTFLGLAACTVELAVLWRTRRDTGVADLAATSAIAAVLALIGVGLLIMGMQL